MKRTLSIGAALFVSSAFAMPSIRSDSVNFIQDAATRVVRISYELRTEPAVVTVDIQTNGTDGTWMSIGGSAQRRMFGDVNRLVTGITGSREITWIPDRDWPFLPDDKVRAEVKAWSTKDPPDWMVVSLVVPGHVRYYASLDHAPESDPADFAYKTSKLLMRRIHAAYREWRAGDAIRSMGGQGYDSGWSFPHAVTLTNDYYIGAYMVTRAQDRLVTNGQNGYGWNSTSDPVETDDIYGPMTIPAVDQYRSIRGDSTEGWPGWPQNGHDVKLFSTGSSQTNRIWAYRTFTGVNFDLPTSAQWEYAARAGTRTDYWTGKNAWSSEQGRSNCSEVAWCVFNTNEQAEVMGVYYGRYDRMPVGLKPANPWGLYDMLGNCREWCLDWSAKLYSSSPQVEPAGPESGTARVCRGGGCTDSFQLCRAGQYGEAGETAQQGYRLCAPCEAK